MPKNVVERRVRCLAVMYRTSPVASPHASNDEGDDIGGKAVVALCASGVMTTNDHDGVASFLVELSHSTKNNNATTMMDQWLLSENDGEQGGGGCIG
mmetsp:Transcript_31158/g.65153  ORF Transcript_31158/g.65153 Transcript_31158/m.65153 type:complete len:97 (+) Transcript_31158:203-493(+)